MRTATAHRQRSARQQITLKYLRESTYQLCNDERQLYSVYGYKKQRAHSLPSNFLRIPYPLPGPHSGGLLPYPFLATLTYFIRAHPSVVCAITAFTVYELIVLPNTINLTVTPSLQWFLP